MFITAPKESLVVQEAMTFMKIRLESCVIPRQHASLIVCVLRFFFPFQVPDVYNDMYPGLREPENKENNQCGIVVDSVNIKHHGLWTCRVFVPGNSLSKSKNVVVTS